MAAELVREKKVMRQLGRRAAPTQMTVEIEEFRETERGHAYQRADSGRASGGRR